MSRYEHEQSLPGGLKVPPHSLEAEQAVLGGLLLDHQAFDLVLEVVRPNDFYNHDNRLIFSAMCRMSEAVSTIDVITVSEALDAEGYLDRVGGLAHLAELAHQAPGSSNLIAYAQIVRERSNLRHLIRIGNEIASTGYTPDGRTSSELIDCAQTAVMALGDEGATEAKSTNETLKAVLDEIDELSKSTSDLTGIATGFLDIDRRTSGLQKKDLIIVAGRPSMGKTTFAMNIVEHVVVSEKENALVFSMEMGSGPLMKRMFASIGRIPLKQVMTGKLKDDSWDGLTKAVMKLKDSGLIIDDRAGLSVQQMRATARKYHKRQPLSLVVVDYLQLASGDGKKDGRVEEVSSITRGLKAMAKELDCPVIALSQLNRNLEQRTDRRPRNSDLRESGSIEQDADVIIMLYRDEVYDDNSAQKGTAEAIFTKFRNGEIGTEFLASRLDMSRFETLARNRAQP